jgi:hypothetical protein
LAEVAVKASGDLATLSLSKHKSNFSKTMLEMNTYQQIQTKCTF